MSNKDPLDPSSKLRAPILESGSDLSVSIASGSGGYNSFASHSAVPAGQQPFKVYQTQEDLEMSMQRRLNATQRGSTPTGANAPERSDLVVDFKSSPPGYQAVPNGPPPAYQDNGWAKVRKKSNEGIMNSLASSMPYLIIYALVIYDSVRSKHDGTYNAYDNGVHLAALALTAAAHFVHSKFEQAVANNETERGLVIQGINTPDQIETFRNHGAKRFADFTDGLIKYAALALILTMYIHNTDYAWDGFAVAALASFFSSCGSVARSKQGEKVYKTLNNQQDYVPEKKWTHASYGAMGLVGLTLITGLVMGAYYAALVQNEIGNQSGTNPHKGPEAAGFAIAISSIACFFLMWRFIGADKEQAAVEHKLPANEKGIANNTYVMDAGTNKETYYRADVLRMGLACVVSLAFAGIVAVVSVNPNSNSGQTVAASSVLGLTLLLWMVNKAYTKIEEQIADRVNNPAKRLKDLDKEQKWSDPVARAIDAGEWVANSRVGRGLSNGYNRCFN